MSNEAIDSNTRHEFPMKTHLEGSKNSELAMAAVKTSAGTEHMPAPWRDEDTCITRSVTSDGTAIACYENRIPAFVETALEERYGSLYSSLAAMRAYGDLANTSVFMATRNGEVLILWLFQRRGKMVRVLNEAIAVNGTEASCFAGYVFSAYPNVEYIAFNAIDTGIRQLAWPLRRENATDDSVLALPGSMQEYLSSLGKATRKNIKRYTARLKEKFPSFEYRVSLQECIDETRVREIISLNRQRMQRKGKAPGINADDERIMLELARRHGMLLAATIDGKTCMGALIFRLRDNYFSFVRAHDPTYDDYRLGLVGACLMIDECIARGGKELHFMWGREPHKAMLLGVEKRLDRLTLYRSSWHMLLNADVVLRNAMTEASRHGKLWLLDKMSRDDDLLAQTANRARRIIRRLRGLRS